MFNISDSIKIGRPVTDVYNFTAELCNLPKWQKTIEYVEGPDGLAKRGDRYTEVRKFMGQEMKTTYEVLDIAPNSHLSIRTADGPLNVHVDMMFEADGSNTRMTTTLQGQTDGLMNIDEKSVQKQFEREMKEDSRELKSILEKKM